MDSAPDAWNLLKSPNAFLLRSLTAPKKAQLTKFKSQSKKSILRVLYLTATCVSCQTWVRQTSGDNGWKLSQDDSSLLEKNDMGGEKKGTGDLSPTLTGESTKQKFKLSLSSLLAFYHQRLLYFLLHEGIRGITTPQCGRHSLRMVSMLACGLRSLSLCPSHNICFVQNTQSTLTVLFSTAEYKWLLANCWESLSKC